MKSEITGCEKPNPAYVDPKGAMPYVFDHRQRMAGKRRNMMDQSNGDLLVRGGQVCRDQEVVETNGQFVVKYKKSKK